MRKPEMISAAKHNTLPIHLQFLILYDQLIKIFKEHLDLDESKNFNCHETGFPTDQSGGKVISVKGEHAFKLYFGERRKISLFQVYTMAKEYQWILNNFQGEIL